MNEFGSNQTKNNEQLRMNFILINSNVENHPWIFHPSLEVSLLGVHQNIYIWTSVSCHHVWVYWRNEALRKRERKGEEEEAALRARERRRTTTTTSSEIGCKKWSLWSRSVCVCNCAAAFLAEEFGRERSIWEEFHRQFLCIFARWLTVCLNVSRVRGGDGGCLWHSLSLSLCRNPPLSLLCIQNTLSLVVHPKRNLGFFLKPKRRRKEEEGVHCSMWRARCMYGVWILMLLWLDWWFFFFFK